MDEISKLIPGGRPPQKTAVPVRDRRQDFSYPPFLCLVGLGLFVRIVLMIAYFPAVMLSFDSPRYARVDSMPIFGDFWMPAGYPILLQVLHSISDRLWFTVAVQHAMGLSVGVLLFTAARRLGVKRSISCLTAAVPLLSGDHLYLEHLVTADYFLTFLSAAGLTAAVHGLVPKVNLGWLAIASGLLAMAALVRSVGIVLLPILVLCTIVWNRGSSKSRARTAAVALLPGAAVFSLYVSVFFIVHGQYLGLIDMSGWNLYSRVAPFADCRKFDPPGGAKILCDQRAPADRPGPYGYVWDVKSVSRINFELGPATGQRLRKFARRAIIHQPLDYIHAVIVDLARYVAPSFAARPYSGQPPEMISFGWRDSLVEQTVVQAMSREYRGTTVHLHGQHILALYQNVFSVRGSAILALAIFTILGMLKARGETRLGIFLFGLTAFGLYLVPVLTISYDFRYGIPPETFLVVSAVLGAASLWPQLRETNPISLASESLPDTS